MSAEGSLRAGVIWSAGGRGASAVANLLALVVYARLLGPEEFGLFALCQAAAVILHNALFYWLEGSALRFLPMSASHYPGLNRTLLCGYLLSFLLLAVLAAIGFGLGGFLEGQHWIMAFILPSALMAAGEAGANGTAEAQRAAGSPRMFAGLVLFRSLAALGLAVTGILWFGGTAGSAVYGHAAGCLFAGMTGLIFWPREQQSVSEKGHVAGNQGLRMIAAYGLPLSGSLLARLAAQRVDRFLIAALLGVEAVGIYAVAYDFARRSIGVPLSLVNLVTYPRMAEAFDRGDNDTVMKLGRVNWQGLILVGLPLAYGLVVVSYSAIPLIFGRQFVDNWTINVVALAAIAILIETIRTQHFDLSLLLMRRTGTLAVISFLSLAMAIVSGWFLTLWFGLSGAAASTCLTAFIALVLSVGIGRQVLPMPMDRDQLVSVLFISAVMAMCVSLLSVFVSGWPGLVGQIGLGAILFVIMALRVRTSRMGEMTGWKR